MGPPGVVPQQAVYQLPIKLFDVVSQDMTILPDERFRQGTVKPFHLALHLWTPGVAVEVHNTLCFEQQLKVVLELAAVVSLDVSQL